MIGLIKYHEAKIVPIQIGDVNLADQFRCFLKIVSSKPLLLGFWGGGGGESEWANKKRSNEMAEVP